MSQADMMSVVSQHYNSTYRQVISKTLYIKMLHLKIYTNSTDFVWSNKDCKQISSSLTKKVSFCLLGSSIPFNDSKFFHPNIHK